MQKARSRFYSELHSDRIKGNGWKVQLLDIMNNLFSTRIFEHMQGFLKFSVEISKTQLDMSLSNPISVGLAGPDHL